MHRLPFTLSLSLALSFFLTLARAAEPFEIKEGDRVLFLGDTLLEREGTYGYLETRMHEQFRDRHFTVRNLSWSGEVPRGWSRASFDSPDKGWERLKEDIAKVRPTVVFLGFGMAASLQEMTDRSGDITLNPDPKRYGEEPMSVARFKKELGELMDAIGKDARFVLLSPIRHEDLRAVKPGLPDPTEHNKLLEQYSKAIEELAKERATAFVDLFHAWEKTPRQKITPEDATTLASAAADLAPNGIHLSELGYTAFAEDTGSILGWKRQFPTEKTAFAAWKEDHRVFYRAVMSAVVRKNELFFHQFRPANSTYLFGFRKHEQGQNAKEMPMFDPLIAAAEAEIDRLKKAPATPQTTAPATAATPAGEAPKIAGTPVPLPDFTVAEGYQIELWAQNPLMEKPTQMNWDPLGRLWVCSSSLYPQIEPGQPANDKIIVLSDTDGDGKADKSEVFADGLLIPTGVVPDLVARNEGGTERQRDKEISAVPPSPPLSLTPSACYVGQSTELLYFKDTDGDGKADQKRIVFSGFGTEDTHHIVHTLRWGPDGRLYFNQSVYIHTHMETPWGMVRLNAGGVFAYDPRTERVEVFCKGLWNTWGHVWDDWGQSFLTDGAGRDGISWAFPGAVFAPSEGSRRQMGSVSPGSYPKFAGLEIIKSPHFPADWQGNLITCDFRAHRIVRFSIEDLSNAEGGTRNAETPAAPAASAVPPSALRVPRSGYVTTEMPDLIRTTDLSFRPIDVRLGPDGALYVADWSNPVINHGEVDFRDPRRDKHMGRIWRITKKDAPTVKWEPLLGKKNEELLDKLLSASAWEKEQARKALVVRSLASAATQKFIEDESWKTNKENEPALAEAFRVLVASGCRPQYFDQRLIGSKDHRIRAAGIRTTSLLLQREELIKDGKEFANAQGCIVPDPDKPVYPGRSISDSTSYSVSISSHLRDANPRGRLEAMRVVANSPNPIKAELILDAILPPDPVDTVSAELRAEAEADKKKYPQDLVQTFSEDPFFEFASWLSINESATQWVNAIEKSTWPPALVTPPGPPDAPPVPVNPAKPDPWTPSRSKQLAYGLKAIDPALAGVAFSKLYAAGKVPIEGPWIDLIGEVGGHAELQRLLDGLLAGYVGECCETEGTRAIDTHLALTGPAAEKAIAALQNAARVRNGKPAAHSELVTALFQTRGEIGLGAIRLAGLWKVPDAVTKIGELVDSRETKPPQRRAAVDGLRAAGGADALGFLRKLTLAEETTDTRAAALVATAQVKLDAGISLATEVLPTFTDDNVLLGAWRGLLGVKGAADAFAAKFGKPEVAKSLPPPVLAAAVRAAREAGKPGAKLLAALAPAAGVSAGGDASKDYKGLAEQTKQNGDPAKGELIYRRATSACVTCHAIGGAGGHVGPDMTSIGASAPLDYLIESILDPNAKVKEGYNAVTLSLLDGEQVTGIQARETATEFIMRDAAGTERGVPKAQVKGKTDIGSMMPAGLTAMFKPREAIDMYAFLSELGKPGPYDASKGSVARVWRMYPGSAAGEVVAATYDPAKNPGFPGYTLVDGRFVKDLLAEAAMIAAGGADTVLLATQFQSSGKTRLKLTGAGAAWLDGQPLALGAEIAPELANGTHTLVVKIAAKELPEVLRAESPDARFLGN